MCAASAAATEFSGAVGSAVMAGVWDGAFAEPPVLASLCVQSTHVQMYRCVDLSGILLCWAEKEAFFELRMFY